ncbi:MAG: hypothetical protein U0169_17135 [Polyangiaceae bacterium]
MKRVLGHVIAGSMLLGLAAVSTSCADNYTSIIVRGVLAPPTANSSVCLYTADPSQPMITSGVMDVAFTQLYTPAILVGNQMLTRASRDNVRTETNRAVIKGVIAKVTDSNGAALSEFTRLATTVVDPTTSNEPTYSSMSVTIVDAAAVKAISKDMRVGETRRLVTTFKLFGETLGHTDVESNEFEFPVDVCYGCLVGFPADSVDKVLQGQTGKPNCAATTAANATTGPGACVSGQDQSVDCRSCVGRLDICDPDKRASLPPYTAP